MYNNVGREYDKQNRLNHSIPKIKNVELEYIRSTAKQLLIQYLENWKKYQKCEFGYFQFS